MSTVVVKTQAEFDAALAVLDGGPGTIEIRSPQGAWINVDNTGSATVRAWGSATVEAWGSATVRASDSATVRASGSATVEASDSATVRASGSATVRASGSATVEASGSATVRASGSATVRASDLATVRAWGSATVRASPHVAVHLHSARAKVHGGVLIDVTGVNDTTEAWLEHHGIEVADGSAVLFKAVGADLRSDHGFEYPIGQTVACDDWLDEDSCGNGLHLSPRPVHAQEYHAGRARFLACRVDVAGLRVITGIGAPKAKVREVTVLHEVDIDGEPLEVTS